MADTSIEWADAVWNPVVGCSKVSDGCTHCYAIREAHRLAGNPNPKISDVYRGLTKDSKRWTGEVRFLPERLEIPLRWRKPRRVFVNSMSDLFHRDLPMSATAQVWARMALADWHVFQVLTKRAEEAMGLLTSDWFLDAVVSEMIRVTGDQIEPRDWPLPNVWLGVSVENQETADERVPLLLETLAAVRWVSLEPMLGPVEFPLPCNGSVLWSGLHWVVLGGESGPGAREMDESWPRAVRDQCKAAGTAFFMKQMGSVWAMTHRVKGAAKHLADLPADLQIREYPHAR